MMANECQSTPDEIKTKLNACPNNSFSIIHFNCRSLNRNYFEIENLLCSLNFTFDIIGLSETWLKNDMLPNNIFNDYKYVGLGRSEKQGGGIGFGIKNNIEYKIRDDLNVFNNICESCFIEILKAGKNIILGVFYRPPENSVIQFIHVIKDILEKINLEHKDCMFMGDYNIDFKKIDQLNYVNEFLETLSSFSFHPLITSPTRITQTTATLIDNIFGNNSNDLIFGSIICDISDHFPIFSLFDYSLPCANRKHFKRQINDSNLIKW